MSREIGFGNKAMELAKKAVSLDGQNAGAYSALANVYARTGQFEKAIAAGKKGLSLDPANADGICLYGSVLNFAGKYEEAIPLVIRSPFFEGKL